MFFVLQEIAICQSELLDPSIGEGERAAISGKGEPPGCYMPMASNDGYHRNMVLWLITMDVTMTTRFTIFLLCSTLVTCSVL